ncbi:TPA: ATP-binding cassette domain-containing protein, partial [Clostridioides difficile]
MLKVNQLCKSYKTGNKTYPILKNISFEINKGEFVAIMGSSGSGKTTLLNCISCFIPIDNGEIILGNNNIRN